MSIYHAETPKLYPAIVYLGASYIPIQYHKALLPYDVLCNMFCVTNQHSNIKMISMLNTQMVVFSFYYPYFHIVGLTLKFMCLGSNTKTHKMKPPCIYSSIILSVCMKVLLCVDCNNKKVFLVFFKFLLNTSYVRKHLVKTTQEAPHTQVLREGRNNVTYMHITIL